jgi:hypothetical protein
MIRCVSSQEIAYILVHLLEITLQNNPLEDGKQCTGKSAPFPLKPSEKEGKARKNQNLETNKVLICTFRY